MGGASGCGQTRTNLSSFYWCSFNAEDLFLNHENADHFIQTLHQAGKKSQLCFFCHFRCFVVDSSKPSLLALKDELLVQTASKLRLATSLSPAILRYTRTVLLLLLLCIQSAVQ